MVCPELGRWRASKFGWGTGDSFEEKRSLFLLLTGCSIDHAVKLARGALALAAAYRVHNRSRHMRQNPREAREALDQAAKDLARGHPLAEKCLAYFPQCHERQSSNARGPTQVSTETNLVTHLIRLLRPLGPG